MKCVKQCLILGQKNIPNIYYLNFLKKQDKEYV